MSGLGKFIERPTGLKIDLSENEALQNALNVKKSAAADSGSRINLGVDLSYLDIVYNDGTQVQIPAFAVSQFENPATGNAFADIDSLYEYLANYITR